MGRRRHRSYIRHRSASHKPFPQDPQSALSAQTRAKVSSTVGFTHNIHSYLEQWDSSSRLRTEKKARRLRVFLQRVVSVNAVGVCAEAVMGYFVVLEDQELGLIVKRDCLKAGVCLLSLIQVVMAVCYWNAYAGYLESVQSSLSPGNVLTKGLRHTPIMVCCCVVEASFYLLTLYPGLLFQLYFPNSGFEQSSDSLVYVLILFRCYQLGRLLYWLCPFSDMRTHIFTRVTTVEHNNGFVMRCCIALYGFRFIAIVCGFIILIFGIMEFSFERQNSLLYMDVVWNDLWLAAFTLTTIGYGNIHPSTFTGQLCMLLCAVVGPLILGFLNTVSGRSLMLSLRECDLYSHLLYTRHKERFTYEAALTLQYWWRLMKMRLNKKLDGPTILRFYSQLKEYRTTLVACQRVRDTLFQRQIVAFDKVTHHQFHSMNEYLQPIHSAYPLLQDIYRYEYRIKSLCRDIYKLTRKFRVYSVGSHPSGLDSEAHTPCSLPSHRVRFGQMAKAKLNAYQNVVGRLIKEEAWTGPREVVRSSADSIPQLTLSQPL